MNKHTTVVSIYLKEKATVQELTHFRTIIDDRLRIEQFSGVISPLSLEQSKEIVEMIKLNQMLNAVKFYKTATGCGLKEAKDAIDSVRDLVRSGKITIDSSSSYKPQDNDPFPW